MKLPTISLSFFREFSTRGLLTLVVSCTMYGISIGYLLINSLLRTLELMPFLIMTAINLVCLFSLYILFWMYLAANPTQPAEHKEVIVEPSDHKEEAKAKTVEEKTQQQEEEKKQSGEERLPLY